MYIRVDPCWWDQNDQLESRSRSRLAFLERASSHGAVDCRVGRAVRTSLGLTRCRRGLLVVHQLAAPIACGSDGGVIIHLIAAHIIHYGGRWLMSISNSTAFFVVICAFVLLAGGSVISWYKQRMLDMIDRRRETIEDA